MIEPFIPYKHQTDALEILHTMEIRGGKGGFLCDSPGMGKTATMSMYLKKYKIDRMADLIICPKSVLYIWEKEINRIYECLEPKGKARILIYAGKNRVEQIENIWDFVIISYNTVRSDIDIINSKFWGRIILDESHTIRNALKKSTSFSTHIVGLKDVSMYRFCLSATPYNNRLSDVVSQANFIGTTPYNDLNWWKANKDNISLINDWKNRYIIKRTKENILPIPKYHSISVIPTQIENNLIQMLKSKTHELYKEWKIAKANKNEADRIRLQACILALITKLRQISNSYYCLEEYTPDVNGIRKTCAKVDAILSKLYQCLKCGNKKNGIVIFSQFTSFLDILEIMLEEDFYGIERYRIDGTKTSEARETAIQNFNDSKIDRVMLVSLLAGGTGISLHRGSSTIFICEPYFNPFVELQAEERVHRLGQEEQVDVYRFTMKNSIEDWLEMLKIKKNENAHFLDMAKVGLSTSSGMSMDDLRSLFESKVY